MSLVRSTSNLPLFPIQSDLNRLFGSLFGTPTPLAAPLLRASRAFVPALDVTERDGAFTVSVDLPGLHEDQVKVEILDGVLTISGEREAETDAAGDGYHRNERAFGTFRRSLTLPDGTDAQAVKATFHDGVLVVTVPKPAASQPQQVQIEVGSAA